jgi:cell division protein FtsQ
MAKKKNTAPAGAVSGKKSGKKTQNKPQSKAEERRLKKAQRKEAEKNRKEQQKLRQQQRQQMEQQLAEENSEAYEELIRRRKQWKRSRRRHSYIFLLFILAIVGAVIAFRTFITISEIRVTGESRYSDEELLLSSGLSIGDHLYDFDPDLVAEDILNGHIYLESVDVKRVFPTSVEIIVSPVMETGVIKGETGYSIISTGGKVLQTGVLYPPSELPIITGLPLSVDQSDAEMVNQLNKRLETLSALNAAMTSAKFTGVTSIDLNDMLSIQLVYQDRIRIILGDNTDLEQKISFAGGALETIDPSKQGVVDVSIDGRGFFREESIHPDYTPVIPETPEIPLDPETGLPIEGEGTEGGDETVDGGDSADTGGSESSAAPQVPVIPPSANIP